MACMYKCVSVINEPGLSGVNPTAFRVVTGGFFINRR